MVTRLRVYVFISISTPEPTNPEVPHFRLDARNILKDGHSGIKADSFIPLEKSVQAEFATYPKARTAGYQDFVVVAIYIRKEYNQPVSGKAGPGECSVRSGQDYRVLCDYCQVTTCRRVQVSQPGYETPW